MFSIRSATKYAAPLAAVTLTAGLFAAGESGGKPGSSESKADITAPLMEIVSDAAQVGQPNWSLTTFMTSLSMASRNMVLTKLPPNTP